MKAVMNFDVEIIRRGATHVGQLVDAPMISALEAETELRPLNWKDVWLRGLELCAQSMGFRVDAIYDADRMLGQIRAFAAEGEDLPLDEGSVREAMQAGSRELLARLYCGLRTSGSYPAECLHRLSECSVEAAAALFLYCTVES